MPPVLRRSPKVSRLAAASLSLAGVLAGCSDDAATAPTTTAAVTVTAAEPGDHAHGATAAVPFGATLTAVSVTEPVDALVNDAAPFVLHDRHRSGVLFSGAADSDHVFFAGVVDGQATVFDAALLFASVGAVSRVPQFSALCVDAIWGVVDGAGSKFLSRIDVGERREMASPPLPDGGGPVVCGGSVAVVAGAGLRTLGIDSDHGHQFWELAHEVTGQPSVSGGLAVVPTDVGVLGLEARDGEELWRVEGSLVARPLVGPQGVWLELADEYRLLSPDGAAVDHVRPRRAADGAGRRSGRDRRRRAVPDRRDDGGPGAGRRRDRRADLVGRRVPAPRG